MRKTINTDKPRLTITGCAAEAVRAALLAKIAPPTVVLCAFDVETGEMPADMVHAVSPHDSDDFTADKILDALADRGWIALAGEDLTPAEERVLRDRLLDLGYIE
jgi:hypothetical protein